jgi:hypothetical protein
MIQNIISSFIISFISFGLYVELNPKIGNIWWRINSQGNKEIRINNLFALMFAPFYYLFYWLPNMWDINFFIWWGITYLFISSLKIKNWHVD